MARLPTPTSRTQLQKFLWFANFYRWFIRDYSKVTELLTRLTSTLGGCLLQSASFPSREELRHGNRELLALVLALQEWRWTPAGHRRTLCSSMRPRALRCCSGPTLHTWRATRGCLQAPPSAVFTSRVLLLGPRGVGKSFLRIPLVV